LNVFELFATINLNDREYNRSLTNAEQRLNTFGKRAQTVGRNLSAALTLPILAIGGASIKAASDLQETTARFNTVFEGVEESANASAQTLQDSFGQSARSARDLLGRTGDLLVGFGFTQDAALGLSSDVNQLAVDLASFNNVQGGADRASQALTSALLGETESLKSLGIVIRQEAVQDRVDLMRATGELTTETDLQAKAIATYDLILEQSGNAIGDYARTQESFANQTRELRSAFEDLRAEIGENLLPVITPIIGEITDAVDAFSRLSDRVQTFIVAAAGIAATLGPAIAAFGFIAQGISSAIGAFRALGAVLPRIIGALFGPAGVILTALLLFAEAYRRDLGGFRDAVNQMFEVADVILGNIAMAFNVLRRNISRVIERISNDMIVFRDLLSGVGDFIKGVFTFDRDLMSRARTSISRAMTYLVESARSGFSEMEGFTFSWENRLSDAFTFVSEEAEDSAEDTEEAFEGAAENVAGNIETMTTVLTDNVSRMVTRSIDEIRRLRPATRDVVGVGPGERPGYTGGPDPFAEDTAQENIEARRQREAQADALAESAARREANLTRRYQENVEARVQAAEEEAQRREELLMRQTEAARNAMQQAMGFAGSFQSAFNAFSNNLTTAVGNMVIGVGNSMEMLAQVVSSGVTAFLAGVGQMIGSAIAGEEGIGTSFARMLLQMIASLSSMILSIMITAKIMGAQWWNPGLAIAGGVGFLAASAGLATLAGLSASARAQAQPSPPPSEPPEQEQEEFEVPEPDTGGGDMASDSDMGASFGGTSQGVQLAVAVPLMDAATIMQSAAQSIQAAFQTDGGMSFGSAAMSFDNSVGRFGGYVDRLVEEGIAVNLTASGSRTAAFRG